MHIQVKKKTSLEAAIVARAGSFVRVRKTILYRQVEFEALKLDEQDK